jgi:hypothetical protein
MALRHRRNCADAGVYIDSTIAGMGRRWRMIPERDDDLNSRHRVAAAA